MALVPKSKTWPLVAIILLALSLAAGCASFRGQPPRLNLVDLRVVKVTPLEQRYQVRLRIQNPNDRDFVITGMNFDLFLNDQHFLSGVNGQKVKVSRYGDAVVDVMATSTVFGLYRQIMALSQGQGREFSYRIKGRLSLDNHRTLPFEKKGELSPQALGQDSK